MPRIDFAKLRIKPDDVRILVLYFVDGLSLADIGVFVEMTPQAVHCRVSRCLKILARNGYPIPARHRAIAAERIDWKIE